MPTEQQFIHIGQGFSHQIYEERLRAALTRANVRAEVINDVLLAEPVYTVASGKVRQISTDRTSWTVVISGLISEALDPEQRHVFKFRKTEDEFIAEAKRAQSHGLPFMLACNVKATSADKAEKWVEQIVFYVVGHSPAPRRGLMAEAAEAWGK